MGIEKQEVSKDESVKRRLSDQLTTRLSSNEGVALPLHPLCALFPPVPPYYIERLARDIAAKGLRDSIVLYKGAILDGRNRDFACAHANVKPKYVEFEGDDKAALAFVISANTGHRTLSDSQLAMVAAKVANVAHGGDRRSDQSSILSLDVIVPVQHP